METMAAQGVELERIVKALQAALRVHFNGPELSEKTYQIGTHAVDAMNQAEREMRRKQMILTQMRQSVKTLLIKIPPKGCSIVSCVMCWK